MTSPLVVWAWCGNKHIQPAHLMEISSDSCRIRWLSTGFCECRFKSELLQKSSSRPRRRPRKFRLVDPEEDDDEDAAAQEGYERLTLSDELVGALLTRQRGDADANAMRTEEERATSPVAVSEENSEEEENVDMGGKLSKEDDDEDTASMSSSSSVSSSSIMSTQDDSLNPSSDDDKNLMDVGDASSLESPTNGGTLKVSSQQQSNVERHGAFSFRGAFLSDSSNAATEETSVFSARHAVQSLGGGLSRRVKSLFSWKRRERRSNATTEQDTAITNETLGTKRTRSIERSNTTKTPLTKKRKTLHATPIVESPNTSADSLIQEVIKRIALEPFDNVKDGIECRRKAGKSLNTFITLQDAADGSEQTTNAILTFASDRYATNAGQDDEDEKEFLVDLDLRRDASNTLKLLMDSGVNPHVAAKDTGQTALHAAAAGGFECAVAALLEHVDYSIQHLQVVNHKGETPLHAALANGHFDCFKLFLKKFPASVILQQVVDAHGEGVLFALVRYTDVAYDQDTTASPSESKSIALLKRLLYTIKQERLVEPMIQKNKAGETVMAVAAASGCLHEVKALSKVEFDCGRSIGNRCKEVNGQLLSPLDLARATKEMVDSRVSQQLFQDGRVGGIGDCNGNPYRMSNWMESGLEPVIDFLEELQQPVELKSLRKVSRYRRGVSQVTGTQVLTPLAQELQNKNAPAAAKNVDPPSIRCDLHEWKSINGSRSQLRAQILDMVREPFTIPQVTAGLIRDPKDPCVRHSNSGSAKHYGLFANSFIPKHTVVCEYSGLVRREDEGEYDANPEYGVKLAQCDEWACKEGGSYANAFILDAEDIFNEASLINDVRDNFLDDDSEPVVVRTENVMYVEVLVNKWPRVFIITLEDIEAGEELLIDYGASYWEKLSLTIMKDKLTAAYKQNEDLKAENVLLRSRGGSSTTGSVTTVGAVA